jgi:hypothetical protein
MCTLLGDTPYSAVRVFVQVCAPPRNSITIAMGTRLQLHSIATDYY